MLFSLFLIIITSYFTLEEFILPTGARVLSACFSKHSKTALICSGDEKNIINLWNIN